MSKNTVRWILFFIVISLGAGAYVYDKEIKTINHEKNFKIVEKLVVGWLESRSLITRRTPLVAHVMSSSTKDNGLLNSAISAIDMTISSEEMKDVEMAGIFSSKGNAIHLQVRNTDYDYRSGFSEWTDYFPDASISYRVKNKAFDVAFRKNFIKHNSYFQVVASMMEEIKFIEDIISPISTMEIKIRGQVVKSANERRSFFFSNERKKLVYGPLEITVITYGTYSFGVYNERVNLILLVFFVLCFALSTILCLRPRQD